MLCALLLCLSTAYAAPPPKTLVVLASGVSLDDFGPAETLAELRRGAGSIALLNSATPGEATEGAAFLSIGAGERLRVPDQTSPALTESGVSRTVAELATEAYTVTGREGTPARLTYQRRFGVAPPDNAAVLHDGLPTLRWAQATTRIAARVGALGDALARANKSVAVYGDWRAALVGMDGGGVAPGGTINNYKTLPPVTVLLDGYSVVVISVGNRQEAKLFLRQALPLARAGGINLVFVAAPPPTSTGDRWERLGVVVAVGPAFPPGSLLTSPTTRTPGLVANVDIAPTILALQGVDTSGFGGQGRPAVARPAGDALSVVLRLDNHTVAISRASTVVMTGYGVFAGLSCLAAVLALRVGGGWLTVARCALLVSSTALIALPAAGWLAPLSPWQYGLAVALVAVLLAFVVNLASTVARCDSLGLAFALVALFVLTDALFGGPLTQRAINNFLPGIRFYGVGNEYMGVAIGAALMGVALLAPLPSAPVCALWGLLAVALGFPLCGANAGGAIAATVAFIVAPFALRGPLRSWHIAVAFAGAAALTALLAVWDGAQVSGSRSHIGEAVALGQAAGVSPLAEIIARKLTMSLGILLNPWTLAALAGVAVGGGWLMRGATGASVRESLSLRPDLARLLPAAFWGAFAALAFNDSGVVAALFLLIFPLVALLWVLLEDAPMAGMR